MSEKNLITDGAKLWEIAKQGIAAKLPASSFASWFEQIEFDSFDGENMKISAASDFAADWVRDNYSDIIASNLNISAGCSIKFEIIARNNSNDLIGETPTNRTISSDRIQPKKTAAPAPIINPRNTFENFVVGDGNMLAHATSLAVAKSPGSSYNPLCLSSASGLGKTHLMHAIAHFIFLNNPSSRIVYTTSERFVNEFISAIKNQDLLSFRNRYRSVDVLMIDDIQFFSGKGKCQEEFFHTFNDLYLSEKQIVLSSDRPIAEIPDLEARLVSRFEWGTPVEIQPPDYETRLAILSKKAEMMSVKIPLDVLDLLARKITKNVRRMEGALNRLVAYISLIPNAKKLDVATVEKMLADTFLQEESSQVISVETIQKSVAEYYKVELGDMIGPRRIENIVFARHVAMYIARKLTTHSLQEIGQLFGGRNHATVMHAISAVENAKESKPDVARGIDYLLHII